MKIVKFLEKPGVLIKGVSEKNKNDAKVQKDIFLGMALGTLGASLLGNMLGGKGVNTAGYGSKDLQSKGGKGIIEQVMDPD